MTLLFKPSYGSTGETSSKLIKLIVVNLFPQKLGLNWFEFEQADFSNRSHPPASYLVHILYKSRELPICNCSPIRGALISCD